MHKGKLWKKSLAVTLSGVMAVGAIQIPGLGTVTAEAATDYNYADALQKSLIFYELQKSGKLDDGDAYNRNNWRGDSCVNDGAEYGIDLTGGLYDAGDHVKFNLPMSYTAANLAWSYLENTGAYTKSEQSPYVKHEIAWICDYLVKCHSDPAHPERYYYQVGNGQLDHTYWGAPETYEARFSVAQDSPEVAHPAYWVDNTAEHGGSTVCAETAAALTAAYIALKDDPEYAARAKGYLKHAKELLEMATSAMSDTEYHKQADGFYHSWSGFYDEFSWANIWLYKATGDEKYLQAAESYVEKWGREGQSTDIAYTYGQSWDDVHYSAALLMAEADPDSAVGKECKKNIENNLDWWVAGAKKKSPKGLSWLSEWGSVRYSTTTAFLALLYSQWDGGDADKRKTYLEWGKSQADYALGSSGQCFQVGYANDTCPRNVHHRAAHGTWKDQLTAEPETSRHLLVGALVGGCQAADDKYVDDRGDYYSNEVACDYNAGFTGLMAAMYEATGYAQGVTDQNCNAIEKLDDIPELSLTAGINAADSTNPSNFVELKIIVYNKTAWPGRVTDQLKYRIYLDLSKTEQSPSDFTVTANYMPYPDTTKISELIPYDEAKGIYYVEVDMTGTKIFPGGDRFNRNELQVRIAANGQWDFTDSYSIKGLPEGNSAANEHLAENIVLYDGDRQVFGVDPSGKGPDAYEGEQNRPTTNMGVAPQDYDYSNEVKFDGFGTKTPLQPEDTPNEEPSKEPSKVSEPSKEPSKTSEPSKEPSKPSEPSKEPSKASEPSQLEEPTKPQVPMASGPAKPSETSEPSKESSKPDKPSAQKPSSGDQPSKEPSEGSEPSREDGPNSVSEPSNEPSKVTEPSKEPSKVIEPSKEPSKVAEPSKEPSKVVEPSKEPSKVVEPSKEPSKAEEPSKEPSKVVEPSKEPSKAAEPSKEPSKAEEPSKEPSKAAEPSKEPSKTSEPTTAPSQQPSEAPKQAVVKILSSSQELSVGQTGTIPFTLSNATTSDIKWKSSDESVVKVENNGTIKAEKQGTATISASVGSSMDFCDITVKEMGNPNTVVTEPTNIYIPSQLNLIEGRQEKLTATITPTEAQNTPITWNSDDATVASVDNNGIVTANKAGMTIITAQTSNGKKASCVVNVTAMHNAPQYEVTEVKLNNENGWEMTVGGQYVLSAAVSPLEASEEDRKLTWTVISGTDVVSIAPDGKDCTVTGLSAGKAIVEARTSNGKNAICEFTITDVIEYPVQKVKLFPTTRNLYLDEEDALGAEIYPEEANQDVIWESEDPDIVSVDQDGNITATGGGTTKVWARSAENQNIGAYCTVKVTVSAESISLNKTKYVMKKSGTFNLTAKVKPDKATNKKVTFKSSNSKVVKITSKSETNGTAKLKALKPGYATITVKSAESSNVTKTLTIVVKPDKVSSLNASNVTNSKAKISWKKSTGATGYSITVTDNKGKKVLSKKTKSTSYQLKNLKAGTKYKVKVKAYVTKNSTTGYSSEVTKSFTTSK